jgi:hypothetical protein
MFGWMLFLHLAGLAVWIGSTLALIVILTVMRSQLGSSEPGAIATKLIRTFSWLAHPSAVVVLGSGGYMIAKVWAGSDEPFWIGAMEKGGGTILLLAIIVTGIFGGRAKRAIQASAGGAVRMTGYLSTLYGAAVLVLAVMLIVSLKI